MSPERIEVLACPETRRPLLLVPAGLDGPSEALFCPASRLKFRVEDGVPVLLVDEAERLDHERAAALAARLEGG